MFATIFTISFSSLKQIGQFLPHAEMAQHSDLEAGTELPTVPIPVALSSAREPVRMHNQPRLRSKRKTKVLSPRTAQASGQAEHFFRDLGGELGNGSHEHCLFVCWENEIDDQRAVPLLIDDREDEVRVYQDLVTLWYERHGWWWRYIPFHKVQMVEEVKASMNSLEQDTANFSDSFLS